MKLSSLVLVAGAGILALVLSRFKGAAEASALPGVTFPDPGTVGVVTGPGGEVLAENYLIGTAEQAYENAQRIRAENPNLFRTLPLSYQDVAHLDIVQAGPDYERGNLRLWIRPEGWSLDQYAMHSWGPEWQSISMAGGSSPAVWHDPRFLGALNAMGITDWRP